ncbi:MAG: P1 family peptidase [Dehalococcoidia bacterium]
MSGPDVFTDIPGIRVGHWTDAVAATGCTVILLPDDGAVAAVSVRGGAPGTRETDVLRPGNHVQRIHAILLTGGSAFGLNAAGGVMRYLEEHGVGFETRGGKVPIVVGAVLYDLGVGDSKVRPGEAEGYAACLVATADDAAAGSVGAGTGATVAKAGGIERAVKGGLAGASELLHDGSVVAALAAVNAYGDITDPAGRLIVRPRPSADGSSEAALDILRTRGSKPRAQFTSTTLVAIATTARLDRNQLLRVAEMGHAGLARAIEPSHAPGDGDIVFAVSCPLNPDSDAGADLTAIGALAARAVTRAIVRAVESATGLAGVPSATELNLSASCR